MDIANAMPAEYGDMEIAEAREAIVTLRAALERAERRHQECWDETERVSGVRERLSDLEREARARAIASAELGGAELDEECDAECLSGGGACHKEGVATCRELLARIDVLKEASRQADLQTAFYALYSAELAVDGARADLLGALRSLPDRVLAEIGERRPTQEELDALPNAWGLEAARRHAQGLSGTDGDEPDPVEQLNYRRWLVELSQGALDYSARLEREMSRHKAELDALALEAENVDFFDEEDLAWIERAIVLQRARIAACREQIDGLACTAGALEKRTRSCEDELRRFLEHAG